jgi:hypothetical protein
MTLRPSLQYNPEPLSVPIPASGCLFDLRPFQIVSLREMVDFEVRELFGVLNRLISVRKDLEKEGRPPLTPEEQVHMHTHLDRAEIVCAKYDIDVSYYTDRARGKIDNPSRFTFTVASAINDIKNCILRDLGNRKFMYIPSGDVEYYDQAELFGPEVRDRFPKANREISAAGNCYATGNYTACVFHLMRAVEYGGRKLVLALKVQSLLGKPIELCEWGDLMSALDEGVKTFRTGSRKSTHKKATFEFYNHAVAQFRNFKDAWRNNVSHTRTTYMPGVTKDIMDNTRQFMQHLASRLKE